MTTTRPAVRIGAADLSRTLGLPEPTPEQAAVIEAPPGAAVVIAGAGSGKTETMAGRVVWLVANGLVPADRVLGLTFTRKAAAELGVRIRRRLQAWARHADREDRVALLLAEPTVLTYAAYSGRLVADHALRLGVEPGTRLVSPAVAWQLADAVVRRYGGELDDSIGTPRSVTNWVLQLAADLADHLRSPADVEAFTDDWLARIDALPRAPKARTEYPTELKALVTSLRHRRQLLPMVDGFAAAKAALPAVDFSDQMVCAARLAQLPEVQRIERDRFQAVLLDEYQDTGHAQIALLHGLFGAGHLVTAVGDPFQSIYGWRGASAGNIGRFPMTFATDGRPAARFTLSTSWRNDEAILAAANTVAASLRTTHPGTVELRARVGAAPGEVVAAVLDTVEAEAAWLAAQVRAAWDAAPGAPAAAAPAGATTAAPAPRSAAVLVRRRAQIALVDAALRAEGLPVEIVGLGGLLTTPEVLDVVSVLQVLADDSAGPAVVRLLTGARWRIGPRDLAALDRRARELANPSPGDGAGPATRDPGSLVEALDDLGDLSRYSAEGGRRMTEFSLELRRLRRRVSAPLPDLVADVERTIGVDVEVAARADRAEVGRAHLDRFLDAAAGFAAEADEATLTAFLAFLAAAEEEENGLEPGEIVVENDRVQILTVHGAKGLEWDIVAVPGLVDQVFPSAAKGADWTRARHLIPSPLRGDSADLPSLDPATAQDRKELAGMIKSATGPSHDSQVRAQHLVEERRLAYVAFTRARRTLLVSGYVWDSAKEARQPSAFLAELAADVTGAVRVDHWADAAGITENPRLAHARTERWPYDPLGARRPAVESGAALVRAALAAAPAPTRSRAGSDPLPGLFDDAAELRGQWRRDVDTLLAERERRRPGPVLDVELPSRLSVSQLVTLREDPDELARRLRRPLPARPAPLARRGTAFHLWLERRWAGQQLLDVDELPGAADDDGSADLDVTELREAFLASAWAARTPTEVEVPFEMVLDGVVVRGRMDAVFAEPDGSWLVVDWKTGAVPRGARAAAAAVQLAAYRLAWQRIVSTDARPVAVESVGAAFHYIRADETVRPLDLLDEDGLRALVTGREIRSGS